MSREEEIAARVAEVRGRISEAARRAGRSPEDVTLVAVTKTRPVEDLLAAWRAGVRHFGENRIQEAEAKFPSVPPGGVRHVIGPVQSNKAARAARIVSRLMRVAPRRMNLWARVEAASVLTSSGVAKSRPAMRA